MIVIFSGPDHPHDPQVDLVSAALGERSLKSVVLNPFNILPQKVRLVQRGSQMNLKINGVDVSPSSIYVSARWRADSLAVIPANLKYPNVFRSQVHQFLDDFRFAFEDVGWFPGPCQSIERADSKPLVMSRASLLDIETPSFTLNSFDVDNSFGKTVFRKKLGFPFVVSVNTRSGLEVGVTTTGSQVEIGKGIRSVSPWQWQGVVRSVAHVRCCIVRDRGWAVASDFPSRYSKIVDFRFLNETDIDFDWVPYALDDRLVTKLSRLNHSLGVRMSCPEFLVKPDGGMVLIDLNPCGDWSGFFSQEIGKEIASFIAKQLSPSEC